MLYSAILLGLLGVGVAAFAALAMGQSSITSFPVLVCASFVIMLSYLGIRGSKKRAEVASCVVVTYFYLVAVLVVMFFFATLWLFLYVCALASCVLRRVSVSVTTVA